MSGIIIDGEYCENSDFICRYCDSPIWEQETNSNYCVSCGKKLCESELQEQNPYHFVRIAIAYLDINGKYDYLKDKTGTAIIFENQIKAEIALYYNNENPEDYYFVEIDYMKN